MGTYKKIRGIIPPMVTPLLSNNELDIDGTERLIEHILAGGVNGIFILGTTGEAQSLSSKVKYEFVELVCDRVKGRVPVLVGITDTSFDESVRLSEFAAEKGAAGVVAAPPFYFPVSQIELIDYYNALASAVPLPLYLYNMPTHVKSFLEIKTVLALSCHPNSVGLKDSSANMTYFRSLVYNLKNKPDFALYVGPEELTGECVLIGADGGINGGANLFPELYVSVFKAADAADVNKVRELQDRIMEVSTLLYTIGKYGSSYLKGVKCALSVLGICSGYLAWPFREFEPSERVLVRKALMRLGCTDIN